MASLNGNGQHSNQVKQNKPRLIFWELTKGCNLRCIHCRATATELSSPSDLSTQSARDIIDEIVTVSTPILVLSGGEPLFRSDIFQLARYGTDKGLRVALATNGTLVSKEVARMIVDSGVQRVAISLDGADALTHDTFRGIPGAFDAAIAGFRNLKNLGMSVQINTTIARHNAHQLPQVLELASVKPWPPPAPPRSPTSWRTSTTTKRRLTVTTSAARATFPVTTSSGNRVNSFNCTTGTSCKSPRPQPSNRLCLLSDTPSPSTTASPLRSSIARARVGSTVSRAGLHTAGDPSSAPLVSTRQPASASTARGSPFRPVIPPILAAPGPLVTRFARSASGRR